MIPQSWVRKLFARKSVRPIVRPRHRPGMEALEDRCVPATLLVNTVTDNTIADNFLTLREAVLVVNAGGNAQAALGRALTAGEAAQITTPPAWGTNDAINFTAAARGTIFLNNVRLEVQRNVTIQGPGASLLAVSVNSALPDIQVFAGATVGISGLTFTCGPQGWGGIRNFGTLTVSDSTISGNWSNGIYSRGTLTVNNTTFSNNFTNSGEGGGGMYLQQGHADGK